MSSLNKSSDLSTELNFINTRRRKDEIKQFLTDSVSKLSSEKTSTIFIQTLVTMGSVVKALFLDAFSPTDCCSTTECVNKLFSPTISGEISTGFVETMSCDEYNFFMFEGSSPFHMFICVKIDSRIYIIQSYGSRYNLKVKDITNEIHRFEKIDRESYDFLFETKFYIPEKTKLSMKYGNYDKLPCDRLLTLISEF